MLIYIKNGTDISACDEAYGIFVYNYADADMSKYIAYLQDRGFVLYGSNQFQEGTSYYHYHSGKGFFIDMLVAGDYSYLALEPFFGTTPNL